MKTDLPTWDQYKTFPRGRDVTAAIAVLEAEGGGQVLRDAGQWLLFDQRETRFDTDGVAQPLPMADWEGWVSDVETRGRGWSCTSHRVFEVAAALATGRPVGLPGNLDELGSWAGPVWRVLVLWGTGRDIVPLPGRQNAD